MSLRLITQIAGIAGSIASVVGVSTSNYRSKKPANTNPSPSHLWKVEEIKNIEVSLKCKRGSNSVASSGASYTLNWSGDLDREELSELVKNEEINVDGELELKAGND